MRPNSPSAKCCVYAHRSYRLSVAQNRESIESMHYVIWFALRQTEGIFVSNPMLSILQHTVYSIRWLLFVLMQTRQANGEKKLIRIDIKEMMHSVGMPFVGRMFAQIRDKRRRRKRIKSSQEYIIQCRFSVIQFTWPMLKFEYRNHTIRTKKTSYTKSHPNWNKNNKNCHGCVHMTLSEVQMMTKAYPQTINSWSFSM